MSKNNKGADQRRAKKAAQRNKKSRDKQKAAAAAKLGQKKQRGGGDYASVSDPLSLGAASGFGQAPSASLSVEERVKRYFSRVPIVVDGSRISFDLEAASKALRGFADTKIFKSQDALAIMGSNLLPQFEHSIDLKTPDIAPAAVAPDVRKHFLMVAPAGAHDFVWPIERLEEVAQWEALKRAIEFSGADLSVQDSTAKRDLRYFSCRDNFLYVNGVAYVPDANHPGARAMHAKMREIPQVAYVADREADCERLVSFFEAAGKKGVTVDNVWFDGGNVIVHPPSYTVFMGSQSVGEPPEVLKQNVERFQVVLDRTQDRVWSVIPVPINSAQAYVLPNGMAPFVHLDKLMSEPLANGEIVITPHAFDSEILGRIIERVGSDTFIPIKMEEALDNSANLISNGENVIASKLSPRLQRVLDGHGYTTITAADFGVKSFAVSDADPHCLTNVIHQP